MFLAFRESHLNHIKSKALISLLRLRLFNTQKLIDEIDLVHIESDTN